MPDRLALPPTITASSWRNIVDSIWQHSVRLGLESDEDGNTAPAWTNRQALAITIGMRNASGPVQPWPLWYQFAAAAYGWDPSTNELDTTDAHGDGAYPAGAAVQLAGELRRIGEALDAVRYPERRVDLSDVWGDPTFVADTMTALAGDGARVTFKIPLPTCRDPRTGKPARPVKDPADGRWKCPGGVVTIDDPWTAIEKSLNKLAVPGALILIAYLAFTNSRRGRRRT